MTAPKSGLKTTEFWTTAVAPTLVAIGTLVFHKDLSGYVPAVAAAAAAVSTAVYSLGRAHLKKPNTLPDVVYDLKQLLPIGEQVAADTKTVVADAP